MNYSELLSSYIKNSKMSLSEISDKLKEMGFSTDKTYLSKLQNGKIPAAGEKLNEALAEILNGDSTLLSLLAFIDKSPEVIKVVLTNFDNEILELLVELARKFPNSSIDLLGDNDSIIENSEELKKIRQHSNEVMSKLLSTGQSDYVNEITIKILKEKFDGLLDFDKHENKIRNTLKSKGLNYTTRFIEKLIYKELDTNDKSPIQIQDLELLNWYKSLPNFDEKKLRKLKTLWDMMEE